MQLSEYGMIHVFLHTCFFRKAMPASSFLKYALFVVFPVLFVLPNRTMISTTPLCAYVMGFVGFRTVVCPVIVNLMSLIVDVACAQCDAKFDASCLALCCCV